MPHSLISAIGTKSSVNYIQKTHSTTLSSLQLIIIIVILECWERVTSWMKQLGEDSAVTKTESNIFSAIFLPSIFRLAKSLLPVTGQKALACLDGKWSGLIYLSALSQWHLGNSDTFNTSVFTTEIEYSSPSDLPCSNHCFLIELIIKFSSSKHFM